MSKIQKGAHVAVEGELRYREYERQIETAEGPVKVLWGVTEVLISSMKLLDRRESQERRGTA